MRVFSEVPEENYLIVAIDGGYYQKQGRGSWAWVDEHMNYQTGVFNTNDHVLTELKALQMVLRRFPKKGLLIHYDCTSILEIIRKDMHPSGTVKERARGKVVRDILKRYDNRQNSGLTTVFRHTPGHTGHVLHSLADHLCTESLRSTSNREQSGKMHLIETPKHTPTTGKHSR